MTLRRTGADAGFLLRETSVTFEGRRITGLVGPPGCGKSVLQLAIIGRYPLHGGAISIADATGTPSPAGVSLVTGGAPLLSHLRPTEAVRLLLALDACAIPGKAELVRALRQCELPDRALQRPCGGLGYFGRLSVWLAFHRLSQRPVLLVDDLTDDLTADEVDDAAALLQEVAACGSTVVFTSRQKDSSASYAHHLFLFANLSLKGVPSVAPLPRST